MVKRRESLRYPGMDRIARSAGPHTPAALVIERAAGRPDVVHVSINAALAPPDKMMFVDHVQVERLRDGVRLLFGKLHPSRPGVCTQGLEVSFPLRPFVNQLFKSVESDRPGGSFHDVVGKAVAKYGYDRIESLDRMEFDKVLSVRSNFVFMALHEDDAAVDFFHLDAATMQMALQGGGTVAPGFKGVVRVVASPSVLLFLLDECAKVAEVLKRDIPGIGDGAANQLDGNAR